MALYKEFWSIYFLKQADSSYTHKKCNQTLEDYHHLCRMGKRRCQSSLWVHGAGLVQAACGGMSGDAARRRRRRLLGFNLYAVVLNF